MFRPKLCFFCLVVVLSVTVCALIIV